MFLFIKKKIQHFINRKKQKRDYPENVDFSIGMLQIENLIHNNVSFLFFNLGESVQLKTKKNNDIYQLAEKISSSAVEVRLSQEDPSVPIVLICENGAKSCLLSTELQAKGFINVFFLEGGMVSYKD